MSIDLLASHSLDLLTPNSNQALWSAMAFRRASGVRALGAPRARKLQPRTRATASRPCLGPHGRTSPRTPRLATTRQPALAPYSATARALMAARRRRPTALRRSAPPKPPRLATWPLEQLKLIHKGVAWLSSPPRSPAATERRFAGRLIHRRGTDLVAL